MFEIGHWIVRRGDMIRQVITAAMTIVVVFVCGCSGPEVTVGEPRAVPYEFEIERVDSPKPGLAEDFNKYIVREDFYPVEKVSRGLMFPQLFDDVFFLIARFESGYPQARAWVAYDTTTGRLYPVTREDALTGYNALLESKIEDTLSAKQAYYIGASLSLLQHSARALALRKEDLYLESRLRTYINDTYQAQPGEPLDVFDRDWWGWEAFPSVNNDYRRFFSAYKDSLAKADFLREVPPDVIGPPEVRKDGRDYYVKILALPAGSARKVQRYDYRISEDGRILEMDATDAFVY